MGSLCIKTSLSFAFAAEWNIEADKNWVGTFKRVFDQYCCLIFRLQNWTHQSSLNAVATNTAIFFVVCFYLKAQSGMYLKPKEQLLAHDEFNERNVPHGSLRSAPAACLQSQRRKAFFISYSGEDNGGRGSPSWQDDGALRD